MIKGLIQSLLVSLGVVSPATNTPSFIKNQQNEAPIKFEANNNHFTLTIDTENNPKTYSSSQVTLGSYGLGNILDNSTYYMKSFNNGHSVSNNYMNIIENETIQETYTNLVRGEDPQAQYFPEGYNVISQVPWSSASALNGKKLTNNLTIYQITPYRWTDENILQWNYRMRVSDYYEGKTIITKLYISTERSLATYVNRSNWATAYQNQTIYETITSAEYGYTYNEMTFETQIDDHLYADIDTELPMNGNITNYIFIYSYIKPNSANEFSYFPMDDQSAPTQPAMAIDNATISGNYIPPISTIEVVDIPGLMFTVLTMPFSFISTAFNITLFPGTPYQVNISELFLAIIGLLIFIWIVGKLIQAKTGM